MVTWAMGACPGSCWEYDGTACQATVAGWITRFFSAVTWFPTLNQRLFWKPSTFEFPQINGISALTIIYQLLKVCFFVVFGLVTDFLRYSSL